MRKHFNKPETCSASSLLNSFLLLLVQRDVLHRVSCYTDVWVYPLGKKQEEDVSSSPVKKHFSKDLKMNIFIFISSKGFSNNLLTLRMSSCQINKHKRLCFKRMHAVSVGACCFKYHWDHEIWTRRSSLSNRCMIWRLIWSHSSLQYYQYGILQHLKAAMIVIFLSNDCRINISNVALMLQSNLRALAHIGVKCFLFVFSARRGCRLQCFAGALRFSVEAASTESPQALRNIRFNVG